MAYPSRMPTFILSRRSISGTAGFIAAAPAILTALGTRGTDVTSTLTSLQSLDARGELESAFEDAPSCVSRPRDR